MRSLAQPTLPTICSSESPSTVRAQSIACLGSWDLLYLSAGDDTVLAAYLPASGATQGVLWLSGADGGLDGPFEGFYARLAEDLARDGVASARLAYRAPTVLEPSTQEALLALCFLEQEGLKEIGVVGFSFGGAVAIAAAIERPAVSTVVTLASQSYGTERVAQLAPRPLLVIHPRDDAVLPSAVAEDLYGRAREPKALVLLPTGDHYLRDAGERVDRLTLDWLRLHLRGGIGAARAGTAAARAPARSWRTRRGRSTRPPPSPGSGGGR